MGLFDKTSASAAIGRGLRFGLVGAMLFLAACATVYRNHGYVPTDDDLALVEVGVDTRETVTEKIGRPTASGLLNDVGWFYVQSRWKRIGALEPKEVEREVVSITFDDKGTVENVERFGLERGQIVPISRRVTQSNIKGMGVLRQIFGSIGRLSAGQILD